MVTNVIDYIREKVKGKTVKESKKELLRNPHVASFCFMDFLPLFHQRELTLHITDSAFFGSLYTFENPPLHSCFLDLQLTCSDPYTLAMSRSTSCLYISIFYFQPSKSK